MIKGRRMGSALLCLGLLSLMLAGGLSAQVNRTFVSRYDGPAGADDEAKDLKLDAAGNIYVTGRSAGIDTGADCVTIKYSPDGEELWVQRYDGPGHGEDSGRALAIDADGNIYVTGDSLGSDTSMDYVTIKYNSDGNELWVRRYDGPDHLQDHALAITLGTSGQVYVTGNSKSQDNKFDIVTVAYDADGNELWVRRFDGVDHGNDLVSDIAVDKDDNVFVTGSTDNDLSKFDYVTIKYGADGTQQWLRIYNGPQNSEDLAWAIRVDADGYCYVTGQSTGSSRNYDYATIKYAPDGNTVWVARFNKNGQRMEDNVARAIAVDTDGFVYVTGASVENGLSDYATVKYTPDGIEVWSQLYHGTGIGISITTAIALDAKGNVYVTGRSVGDRTGLDYVTIKYDADGVQQWLDRYNGPGNAEDAATALALDGDGNVYVTGSSVGLGTGADYATIKYRQSN